MFRTVKSYWITKGNSFSTTITKQETELTPEMIARYVEMHSPQSFSSSSGKACAQSPHCRGLGSIPTQAHSPLAVSVSLQGPE